MPVSGDQVDWETVKGWGKPGGAVLVSSGGVFHEHNDPALTSRALLARGVFFRAKFH
jgi:hypothetical protein